MTIRDLVKDYLLADATIAALIGTRLYPDMMPEKVTFPAVVIQSIDVIRPGSLRTVAGLATARLQLDVYAAPSSGLSSRAAADAIGSAVRQRLDRFDSTLPDPTTSPATNIRAWIMFDVEREQVEPEIHGGLSRHTADYLVQFQTQGGAY